jgi:TonB family protein
MQCRALAFAGLALVVGGVADVGCTVGAPRGFSSGDHWTFPLVGPLEDGLLVTPVSVRGHGPYLFAIDPDANVSAVDKQVTDEAQLRTATGPHRIDETDIGQIRFYVELLDLKVGNLTIDRRDVMLFPAGFYDTEGRHVNGILGRDALADSLVFGFDRDQGIATLSTVKAFTPPPDAVAIKYDSLSADATLIASAAPPVAVSGRAGGISSALTNRPGDNVPSRLGEQTTAESPLADVVPVPRRLATVQIGGARLAMHLDLGAAVSQLRQTSWDAAGLAQVNVKLRLVDEAASTRTVTRAGIATDVALGAAKGSQVLFVPYVEKRFVPEGLDGALGLDFFRPYAVYANWDSSTYYLKPRGDAAATLAARVGRWGTALPACPHPGCITAALATTPGGTELTVTRDPAAASHPLEVHLGVTLATGKAFAPLVVELPASVDKITGGVPAELEGATIAVLDVSPFPRPCTGDGGCVFSLGSQIAQAAAPAAPGPPPSRTVLLDKLHRLTGEASILPNDEAQRAAGGKPMAIAIVRVCLGAEGKVDSAKVVKSSGVAAYDDQLQRTIQDTWTFEPVEPSGGHDGKPIPVCAAATFATQ